MPSTPWPVITDMVGCSECGIQTDDEWHTCLPCVRCEHDKPYHNVPDDYPANVLCSWPTCDCAGYLGVAA